MPQVVVRLFGHLREYLPHQRGADQLETVPDGATLGDLLDRLKIPPADPKVLLVNGVHAGRETPLSDGDRISVFPPVAGG